MGAFRFKPALILFALVALAACTSADEGAAITAPVADTTLPEPPVMTTRARMVEEALPVPRLEIWGVGGMGASRVSDTDGPFFVVLDDGTVYLRHPPFGEPLAPVWTGELSDPSSVENLIADLPRGGDSTFGASGSDAGTVIVVLDGEPVTAIYNPRLEVDDPEQKEARDLALEIIYNQLAKPEWWNSSGLLQETLRRAELDAMVGFATEARQRSTFDDAYRTEPYVEVSWPLKPPRPGCFSLEGSAAEAVVEALAVEEGTVLWTLPNGQAFLTQSERWLLPYETPCDPDGPSLAARFDE